MSNQEFLHTIVERIVALRLRREQARATGGKDGLQRHRASGRSPVRKRMALLADEGSWFEIGALALPELRARHVPGDGAGTDFGKIDGRRYDGPGRHEEARPAHRIGAAHGYGWSGVRQVQAQVQVSGVADDRLGKVPGAFVELVAPDTLDEQAVIDPCDGQLAKWEVPGAWWSGANGRCRLPRCRSSALPNC